MYLPIIMPLARRRLAATGRRLAPSSPFPAGPVVNGNPHLPASTGRGEALDTQPAQKKVSHYCVSSFNPPLWKRVSFLRRGEKRRLNTKWHFGKGSKKKKKHSHKISMSGCKKREVFVRRTLFRKALLLLPPPPPVSMARLLAKKRFTLTVEWKEGSELMAIGKRGRKERHFAVKRK